MQNDIFGAKAQLFGGAFSADDAFVQFALSSAKGNNAESDLGLAIESSQYQYQQRVGKAYDVTQPVVYVIRGRSEGNGAFQQIAGVRELTTEFLQTYGDVCSMDENSLVFSTRTGCGSRFSLQEQFTMGSMLLVGISQQVSAEDMMIRRSLPFTFLTLIKS